MIDQRPYTSVELPTYIEQDQVDAVFKLLYGSQDISDDAEIKSLKSSAGLLKLLAKQDDRSRTIFILKFGLDGSNPRSYREVSDLMNVTSARIQQILLKASAKMRANIRLFPSDLFVESSIEHIMANHKFGLARNCLMRSNIRTLDDLTEKTEVDLMMITGFGKNSLNMVKSVLAERGLSLA